MANNFLLDADNVARVALGLVKQDMVLGNLVYRDAAAEFGGGRGSVVKVPVPGALPARTRGIGDKSTALTDDEISETSIDVSLDTLAYSSVLLSEADLSLNITDFTRQVLMPQARAVASYCERTILAAMQATPETTSIALDSSAPAKLFTAARSKLRQNGVPASAPLYAVVGTDVAAALLDGPAGTFDGQASTAGNDDGSMGVVRGFRVYESNRLAADEVICFIKEAFALTVRAPEMPQGAAVGKSLTEDGFALRWLADYQSSIASDRSLVATFVGAKAMPLAVPNETTGEVSLVANGGAVRVLTAS